MKKEFFIALIITILYFMPQNVLANSSNVIQNTSDNTTVQDNLTSQESKYGIGNFLSESKKYTDDLDINNIFNSSLTGKFDNTKILKNIFKLFEKNAKNALTSIAGIIIIVIINSILKTISENLGNESVSKVASYVQYILIVTLIMKNFSDVTTSLKETMQNLNLFANSLIPLLMTMMIATGNIVSAQMIEPILLLIVTFLSNFIINIVIPMILLSTALGIVSKISNQIQVDKLSKALKSASVWVTTTILTIFISLSAIEGGVTSSIDGVTAKVSKSVVSAAVPIVGNILGDAVSTVIGYANILKNALGTVGIIVIVCICAKPIIEIATLTVIYYLGAALCEPIADKNVVELIQQMGDTLKIFLAILFVVMTILIIGLAIVMKISNNTVMYN